MKDMHDTWADEYDRYQSYADYPGGEAMYKERQWDVFFMQVESGEKDDFFHDLFTNDVDKAVLAEYLADIGSAKRSDLHDLRARLGGYIERCMLGAIESEVDSTEVSR